MKFTITVKNPDSIEDSIDNAVEDMIQSKLEDADFPNVETMREEAKEMLWASCKKWVEYQEYIRIEIDTENGTATVLEV